MPVDVNNTRQALQISLLYMYYIYFYLDWSLLRICIFIAACYFKSLIKSGSLQIFSVLEPDRYF